MKKLLFALLFISLTVLPMEAQPRPGNQARYGRNGYENGYNGRHGYDRGYGPHRGYGDGRLGSGWYGGVKIGMVASSVNSESDALDGNRIRTGLSIGAAAGFSIAPMASFETGLYYAEKGGSSRESGSRFSYELNYLEVPLLLKFNCPIQSQAVIQPYIGFYLGLGISGDIKDYQEREAFSSYSDGYFRHGDSGVRLGCGFAYSFLYAGLGFDLGLTNIGQDLFDETRNRSLILEIGFSF